MDDVAHVTYSCSSFADKPEIVILIFSLNGDFTFVSTCTYVHFLLCFGVVVINAILMLYGSRCWHTSWCSNMEWTPIWYVYVLNILTTFLHVSILLIRQLKQQFSENVYCSFEVEHQDIVRGPESMWIFLFWQDSHFFLSPPRFLAWRWWAILSSQ